MVGSQSQENWIRIVFLDPIFIHCSTLKSPEPFSSQRCGIPSHYVPEAQLRNKGLSEANHIFLGPPTRLSLITCLVAQLQRLGNQL